MADPRLTVTCSDDERRLAVADPASGHNGIDWVEVDPADQRTLHVGFLHPLPGQAGGVPGIGPAVGQANVVIEGGERVRNVAVLAAAGADRQLTVTVDRTGDFSPYVLRLVRSGVDRRSPVGFDPVLAAATFSFKANCPSDLDCAAPDLAAGAAVVEPVGDYLAKDYEGFRRLMLDRLSALIPDWSERNPADPLVTAVEALAHAADRLSYRQDAAATEAYLGTARSRISVRRHARMLDYRVHDGCTARTWLQVQVAAGSPVETGGLPAGTVALSWRGAGVTVDPSEVEAAAAAGAVAFETLAPLDARAARNRIAVHTWGGVACRLPTGSTRATLVNDPDLGLVPGDLLVFEEVRSPVTGRGVDADPRRRHVVRLTDIDLSTDPVERIDVAEVTWGLADALPFDLTVTSMVAGDGIGATAVCAVARGNLVPAHHALEVGSVLPPVPVAGRWRPVLTARPLACAEPLVPDAPASDVLQQDSRRAVPLVRLEAGGSVWRPRVDLLGSDRFDQGFVVEVERDGRSSLRFGDDVHGQRPAAGLLFSASWRQGGGAAGNVGHGVLTTLATTVAGVETLTNPLPAVGGTDPEPMAEVRQFAPSAFTVQERAVTAEDWVTVARRHPEVQDAATRLRWTGSWWTVFVTLDLIGGRRLADEPVLAERLHAELDRFRIAGYDLELRDPVDVPVTLELTVCLAADAFRSDVLDSLLAAFANRDTAAGRGFFHPDNFSFGRPLHTSPIIAVAMAVPGVRSVRITALHPVGVLPVDEIERGLLAVGPLEVIRLDNDASVPERGVLTIVLEGGL